MRAGMSSDHHLEQLKANGSGTQSVNALPTIPQSQDQVLSESNDHSLQSKSPAAQEPHHNSADLPPSPDTSAPPGDTPPPPAATTPEAVPSTTRPAVSAIPEFTCVGWRQTGGCSPDGPREPDHDRNCGTVIKNGNSGFCLLRNDATGEEVQAMRVNCTSMRTDATFKCDQAVSFAQLPAQISALVAAKQQELLEDQVPRVVGALMSEPNNGVLMVMYPDVLSNVYATIRLLRSYNCTLPVELWYLEREMGASPLASYRVLQSLVHDFGPISLRGIKEEIVTGFNSKVFALAHSALDQVLFLDADNTPVKDPTYLFTTPEFLAQGTIFWPDFWHPVNTIFNVNAESLVWELVGTPFVDMFEQESGQLLIDRRRAGMALQVVQLLAFREPDQFKQLKLVHGDKDLFRLAWLKTQTSFHMIGTPAAAAGIVKSDQFCGMTMVQHDTRGDVLFLHHNGKKLIGNEDQKEGRAWTHLQSFVFPEGLSSVNGDPSERYTYMTTHYHVAIYSGGAIFPARSMCYGDRKMNSKYYRATPWEELPFHDIEDQLLKFALAFTHLEAGEEDPALT
ncbi:hypothetical protein BBJ28_00024569 [Nothophytophthora sp. Chile5]|nr:hypothetical protein BBJ28_00024569 [Nothophytophthora sp. Chile5]